MTHVPVAVAAAVKRSALSRPTQPRKKPAIQETGNNTG